MTRVWLDGITERTAQLERYEVGAKEAYQRYMLDPSDANLEDWISARKLAESYRWLHIGNAEGIGSLLNYEE